MRELNYALYAAKSVEDPQQRTQMLASAVANQAQIIALIAKALEEAEQAALSITDPAARLECIQMVNKVMERVGYSSTLKVFRVVS